MAVLGDFTPLVQRISIDEAFLDITGSVHLFGPAEVIGDRIRQRVRAEVGLPISVGAARTKHLAKIASQVAKPDGLVVVQPASERAFLDPLPVGLVWGIGPVTRQRLAERGIYRIGQLAASPDGALQSLLGRALGAKVGALAANDDQRRVRPQGRAGSLARSRRSVVATSRPNSFDSVLGHLADRVAGRMRAKQRAGRTITVRVRFAEHARGHPVAHRPAFGVGDADPHRDRRAPRVPGARRSSRRVSDLVAGHLGVESGRPAGVATGVAIAARRARPTGLAHRCARAGQSITRSMLSGAVSAVPRSAMRASCCRSTPPYPTSSASSPSTSYEPMRAANPRRRAGGFLYVGGVTIEPETKSWTWVLERKCEECGFDTRPFPSDEIGRLSREAAEPWPALLAHPLVRVRPQEDCWSALEYGCHVRDVFRLGVYRVRRMLEEDDPRFENWDQNETAVAERYDLQDPSAVATELLTAATALADLYDTVQTRSMAASRTAQ